MEPPPPASDYERLRRLSPKIDLLPSSVETLSPDEGVLLSSLITDGQGDVDVAAAAEIADRAEAENEVKRHYACAVAAKKLLPDLNEVAKSWPPLLKDRCGWKEVAETLEAVSNSPAEYSGALDKLKHKFKKEAKKHFGEAERATIAELLAERLKQSAQGT